MINSVIHRKLCKEYEEAASEFGECIKLEIEVPSTVKKKFYRALETLRFFLDAQGIRMPEPKVKYNPDDMTTWGYR